MFRCLAMLFVLLFGSMSQLAQLKTDSSNPKKSACVALGVDIETVSRFRRSDGGDDLIISLKLKLKNNARKPALLLKSLNGSDVPVLFGAQIRDGGTKNVLVKDDFGESYGKSKYWMQFVKELNVPTPPSAQVITLKSNESLEIRKTITIQLPSEANKDGNFPRRESLGSLGRVSNLQLILTFQTWSNNLDANFQQGNFYKTLRSKWRQFGTLVSKNLVSEPISLVLSSIE